jgi:hypothetical protein
MSSNLTYELIRLSGRELGVLSAHSADKSSIHGDHFLPLRRHPSLPDLHVAFAVDDSE